MHPRVLDTRAYAIENVANLSTPRLVVYRQRLEQNISLMRRYLESVVPGSGFRHLLPHVKTHKSAWVTNALLASGIRKFKCSLQELDMLLDSEAEEIFVAYPLLPHDADRVAAAIANRSDQHLTAQIGCTRHVSWLTAAARRHGVEIDCLLDINVGYDRTGVLPEAVLELARELSSPRAAGLLRLRGVHAYAGQNDSTDPGERASLSKRTMTAVADCMHTLEKAGQRVERVVVAGTPSFLEDLRALVLHLRVDAEVEVSPGTWIYWDTHCEGIVPGMFEFAALLVGQVMDLPAPGLATLNLGSKRWSTDKGSIELFSIQGLEVASVSEEHTVLRLPEGRSAQAGERVLLAPRHICPTVNLWESFVLVGERGRVERSAEPVTARNR